MKKSIFLFFLAFPPFLFSGLREGTSEFQIFLGPHFGDTFIIYKGSGFYEEKKLNDSLILGMRASYFYGENFALEFTLAGTKSDTTDGEDFDIYYYQGNLHFQFGEGSFNPFFTIGMGVSTLRYFAHSFQWEKYKISDTKFSWNWGAGFKIYFTDEFAFRTDLRAYYIYLNERDYWWHDYYYRWEEELITTELSFGFIFRF